jgi:hypothetical protein
MRIRISYADQNESMRPFFPVSGIVGETELHAATGEHDWRIVDLDQTLRTPAGEFGKLLIAPRWKDHSATDPETSVFVLGVPMHSREPGEGFDVGAYPWLVWGIATPE